MHKSPSHQWRVQSGGSCIAHKGEGGYLHAHTCWEWVYYCHGSIDCIHGSERLRMSPGTLWITPPGVTHAEIATEDYSNLHFEVLGPSEQEIPLLVQDDSEGTLGNLLRITLDELRGQRPGFEKMIHLMSDAVALHIDRFITTPPPTRNQMLVRNAESLWGDRPQLSVEEVSRSLGVSVSGLRQSFQSEMQCSPVERRMHLRADRAVRMLQTSTLKLEAVATLCGFHSASHLSRCIKAATGSSTGRLRRARDAASSLHRVE